MSVASNKFEFKSSDVLFGKLRPNLAKICRPNRPGVCSTDLLPLSPGPQVDRGYLAHFLSQQAIVDLATSRASGANLPRLSPKALGAFKIPLPPLEEQRRIADILDQAEALRVKRREAIAHLDYLTQSIFYDMFGDPGESDESVDMVPLDSIVAELRGGRNIVADDMSSTTTNRVLKISAVTSMNYQPEQSKPVPDDYEPPEDHFVRASDLIMSRANTTELVGALAYVWATPRNMLLPDKLWKFVWAEPRGIEPLFMWSLFQTRTVRRALSARSSGTGGSMKNIPKAKLMSMRIPCPPLPAQEAFARRVEKIEATRGDLRTHLTELNTLFASLQHRAFAGEL